MKIKPSRRGGISTVIGTVLFISAALLFFVALVEINVGEQNYQSAQVQANILNSQRSSEMLKFATYSPVPANPNNDKAFTITNTGAVTTTFSEVLYVYHGTGGTLQPAVASAFATTYGLTTCPSVLPPGGTCNYDASGVTLPGAAGLQMTSLSQRPAVGLVTSYGNTFWFNETSVLDSPTYGVCTFSVTCYLRFNPSSMSFYEASTSYAGSGYQVGGYLPDVSGGASEVGVSGGRSVVFQATFINVDPSRLPVSMSPDSTLSLCPPGQNNCTSWSLSGGVADGPGDQTVTVSAYPSPAPQVPYGQSVTLYFGASQPGGGGTPPDAPSNGQYVLTMQLFGSDSGGAVFSQTATLGIVSITSPTICPSVCNLVGMPGGEVTAPVSGFSSAPRVYWVGQGGTLTDVTYSTTKSQVVFTIPTGTAPGTYQVDVVDGTNYAYGTVQVASQVIPSLDPNSQSHAISKQSGLFPGVQTTVTISTTDPGDLVYACEYSHNTGLGLSVSDSASSTWNSRGVVSGGGGELQCWYAIVSGVLSSDLISFSADSATGYAFGEAISVANVNFGSPFDPSVPSAVSATGNAGTATSTIPMSGSTGNAHDVVISVVGAQTTGGVSAGGGFSLLDSTGSGFQGGLHGSSGDAYLSVSSTGSYSPQFSFGSSSWVMLSDAIDPTSYQNGPLPSQSDASHTGTSPMLSVGGILTMVIMAAAVPERNSDERQRGRLSLTEELR